MKPLDIDESWLRAKLRQRKFRFHGYNVFQTLFRSQSRQVYLGWGRKSSGRFADWLAATFGRPRLLLEEGFIRSVGHGRRTPSCSLVLDDVGIYYDATAPSRLEGLLCAGIVHDETRARSAIRRIRQAAITKYNHASLLLPPAIRRLRETGKSVVLLIDQTRGDLSLQYGYANDETFSAMLQCALTEHPDAHIVIKTHPDVIAGKKQGCFSLSGSLSDTRGNERMNERITVVGDAVNPLVLLEAVDCVYVATSQVGFEALMLGKPVVCFGVPFYAGWGLTDDRADPALSVFSRRKNSAQHPLTVEAVFSAAYLHYSRYLHPDTQQLCELEAILDYFEIQYRAFRENTGDLFCFGFTVWKKKYIRTFLQSPDSRIHFVWTAEEALAEGFHADAQLVVWGNRAIEEAQVLAERFDVALWRVEDGFLRSVGLGSDFTAPLSLVLDKRGVYYDPCRVSDLEFLLQHGSFQEDLLVRARRLHQMLLATDITKYNLGLGLRKEDVQTAKGQKIILVPGQVEDDASIRQGCRDVKTNAGLLVAVRRHEPDAYVIYKPHPDVLSGNRIGVVSEAMTDRYADLVLEDVSIADCLKIADEIHTMTSLVGFEALLRGVKVTCYGIPFYAGWGLTHDMHLLQRRSRRLSLDELIVATLIAYPRYIHWETGLFTTPDFVTGQLYEQLKLKKMRGYQMPWIYRKVNKAYRIAKGIL